MNDWGIDVDSLAAEAYSVLATKPVKNKRQTQKVATLADIQARRDYKGLNYLIKDTTIVEVLKAYFRTEQIEYSGHVILQIKFELGKRAKYFSGLYHNDRCGRRIKLFVNLHDVEKAHRPTLI